MKKKLSLIIILIFVSTSIFSKNIEVLLNKDYTYKVLKYLKNAKKEVIISSFMWCCHPEKYGSLPCKILDEIIHLVEKGVKVTIILEKDIKSESSCNKVIPLIFQKTLLRKYKNLKIYFDDPFKRSHQKIILIDKNIVFIGSHNITQSALKYNNEVSVLIKSKKVYKKLKDYLANVIVTSNEVY